MAGCRRNGSVITKSGSTLAVGAYYLVNVLPPGGIATGPASGATLFLERGHGFSIGHKVMIHSIASGTFTFLSGSAITMIEDDFINLGGIVPSLSLEAGDVVFNMALDNSAGATPNWNGNGTSIFSEIGLQDAIPNQVVASDDKGLYTYCWSGERVWEAIRNPASGLVVGYELDIASGSVSGVGGTLPAFGDFPGQTFMVAAQGGNGAKWYAWLQLSDSDFDWVEVIGAP